MKEHTVKLSGHAKDRFLERFFAEEEGLDGDLRQRLVARSISAFSSLRVRKAVLARQPKGPSPKLAAGIAPVSSAGHNLHVPVHLPVSSQLPMPAVQPMPGTSNEPPAKPASPTAPAIAFDAFAIKLVPVFQREGRDGLLAKLGGVTELDHLRQMAKAQQVVLPQPLRAGDADIDAVRLAIADAVAKRIADRRAAAG